MSAPFARAIRAAQMRWTGVAGPLAEALAIEQLPRAAIDALVSTKLAALVAHAAARVPFWRERLAAVGIEPAGVRTIGDLAALPPLTKDDLRAQGAALLDGGRVDPAWIRNASGGSTGVPVEFYQDRDYHRRMLADQARHVTWTGLPWWTPRAFTWGADRDSTAHTSFAGRVRDRLDGTLFLNTFRAADADYAALAARCAAARIPLVVGYASSLEHFARVVARERAEGRLGEWRPVAAQSSAERLSPDMRQVVEGALGCSVFDRYGSREMGNVAHECTAHAALHVSMERVIVEVLQGNRPAPEGEEGELVITVLDNRAEPLLRYAIGDLGRRLAGPPCACGRAYERIEITAGRASDLFTAPSGRRIHGEYFTHLFYNRAGIAAFRLTQETRPRLVLEVVRGQGDFDGDLAFVLEGIREIDPGFVVETQVVAEIPAAASGKRRFTTSKVPVTW